MQAVTKNLNFHGGIEQSIDSTTIKDGYAPDMLNISVKNGIIEKVQGAKKWCNFSNFSLRRLIRYNVGTTELLMGIDETTKKLYILRDTNGYQYVTDVSTMNLDYVNYQAGDKDILIFTNGVDPVRVYDRLTGSVRSLKRLGSTSNASDTLNRAPVGRLIELHKERIFIAGSTAAPNTIYFSKDFDPDDFTTPTLEGEANMHGGLIDLPSFDGSTVIAIKSLFDSMVVFKNYSLFKIYGDTPMNYNVSQIFASVNGRIIDRTIQSVNNKAFWVSTEGVFMFNSIDVKDMTPRIKKEFSKYTKTEISNAAAIVYKGQYIIAIKNKFIIYDITYDTFTIRTALTDSTKTVFDFCIYEDMLLYSANGVIMQFESDSNIDGVPFTAYIQSKLDNFGYSTQKKKIKQIDFIGNGTGQVEFGAISEKGRKSKVVTLTNVDKHYKVQLKNRGFLVGMDFKSLDGGSFQIKELQMVVELS